MDWGQIDLGWILINVVVLLFSLSLHESAHAWTADRLGDGTARRLGRVTLNPLVHVDPIGTILFPLLGLLSGWALFGWAKPVPVNPVNFQHPRRDHLLVAAAGPISNLLAVAVFLVGLKLLAAAGPLEPHPILSPLRLVCQAGLILNVILAVFNLIPVPPLDGSWIVSGLLPEEFSRLLEAVRPYGFLILLLLLWSGFFRMILVPVLGFVQALAA